MLQLPALVGIQVGTHALLTLPPNPQRGEGERKLQLLVRAEGPTRVLSVVDIRVSALCAIQPQKTLLPRVIQVV